MAQRIYDNRVAAGLELAAAVSLLPLKDPVVLALPRGGVPVAAEVARRLGAPMDVMVVRKIGAPDQPELALGAVASGGISVMNDELVGEIPGLESAALEAIRSEALDDLARGEQAFRKDRPYPDLRSRDVVVVDDGMATGATMRAAIRALRKLGAASIVVAVPTASPHAVNMAEGEADRLVCLDRRSPFFAVGNSYRCFEQISDDEVLRILDDFAQREQLFA